MTTTPTGQRRSPTHPDNFYGRHIAVISAILLCATAPGQTVGVSAFIDPMIADLGISRSQISVAYLIGTLAGAVAMPTVGQAIDRFGVRRSVTVIGALFGGVLLTLSVVAGPIGLTLGFAGIRLLGQGALGLCATTAVTYWFVRRRGTIVGLVSSGGAVGISLAPVGLERLIHLTGWRTAWAIEAVAVWAIVVPLAALALRDRPSSIGQHADGRPLAVGEAGPDDWGLTRRQALRAPFFWLVTAGVATSGLLNTAIAFHQISLLGERGLTAAQAAGNFIPQTVAGLAASLLAGLLIDTINPRWLTFGAMITLGAGVAWGAVVSPGWSAIGFGMVIGAAGNSIRALEGGAFPRYFGTRHIGSIRGIVAAVSVGSTAFGPLLFARIHDLTGTYASALVGCAALPVVIALVALFVPPPRPGRVVEIVS